MQHCIVCYYTHADNAWPRLHGCVKLMQVGIASHKCMTRLDASCASVRAHPFAPSSFLHLTSSAAVVYLLPSHAVPPTTLPISPPPRWCTCGAAACPLWCPGPWGV